MVKKILGSFFTFLGIIASLIILAFFICGKWIEYDCKKQAKVSYKNKY